MPLRNQIEAIVTTLPGAKTFYYGTSNEVNVKADNTVNPCIICLFPLSPITITLSRNGSANNFFDIYMEFLYITKFEKSTADNEDLVNNAMMAANRFLLYLREYKVGNTNYFEWKDTDQATARPVYNKYDVNTTGVSLSFKVKRMANPALLSC